MLTALEIMGLILAGVLTLAAVVATGFIAAAIIDELING